MRYEGSIFRPPSEARSYILQCTIGCTHNRCTFCAAYKDKKFRIRTLYEIKTDIRMAKLQYGDLEKVFLADGDAIAMETMELLEILDTLRNTFPSLNHIGIYVSPDATLRKEMADLIAMREAGLTIGYLGVETGDPPLLESIRKGVTYDEMVEAGRRLNKAGILNSVTVLLGLAGRTPQAVDHAQNTARILNDINPDFIAALTLMVVPKTELYRQMQRGEFELPGPFEILEEMRLMIAGITVDEAEFRSNHASNYLPIKGRLQRDKEKILNLIDEFIAKNDRKYLRPEYMRGL